MSNLSFDEDKKKLEKISREDYNKIFAILRDNIWQYGGGLTFGDIKSATNDGIINNDLVSDLGSEEDIVNLLNKIDKDYSSEESEEFIIKVKASNVTDISESGYFYKKLASCMDSVNITEDDCNSEGWEIDGGQFFGEIDDDTNLFFDFKVKNMYIQETNKSYSDIDDLVKDLKKNNLQKIHVRTPITCKLASTRCFCKKCCGKISAGDRDLEGKNIGIIATLAITENVTQSCLSSMNNGIEENANSILEKPFELKTGTFEDFLDVIRVMCDKMKTVGIQSRWYEIALIGRIYKKDENLYSSTTFITSSKKTNDPIGSFLFRPSKTELLKLLCGETNDGNLFKIRSCKAKNLFGLF